MKALLHKPREIINYLIRKVAYKLVIVYINLVWFGLVYLLIHSVTHITLDMSITDYNLYITTRLIIYGHPPNIINTHTRFKDQLEVESVSPSRNVYLYIPKS